MNLLDYDIKTGTHRSAIEEWKPHKPCDPKFFEWHYITCPMTGANGHQYLFFISNINFSGEIYSGFMKEDPTLVIPEGHMIYSGATHFCDYTTNLYKSQNISAFPTEDSVFDEEQNMLKLDTENDCVRFSYNGNKMELYVKTEICELELSLSGADRVLWHQDSLQIPGLIQEGAEGDYSFYYSLPNLPFFGKVTYTESDGRTITTEVYGTGWVDRQWGDFISKSWEWSSFRFGNGDRVNLYNFAGGHQAGSYQTADGTTEYFDHFTVYQNGYSKTADNIWFSYGWSYDIPVLKERYKVVPLSDQNTIISPGNSYYEGLGKLLNEKGEQVGWAVNESMDVRKMNNAPYGEYQFFMK